MSSKHQWVELKFTPVEIESNGENVDVFTTEAADEIAHEDAEIQCWFCNAELSTDNFDEECVAQLADAMH